LTDVFEEVEGQMRVERYRSLGRKLLPWLIGLAVLALLAFAAFWGWREWIRRGAAEASVDYAAALTALQANNQAEAQRRLTAVSEGRSPAYKALALQQRAAIQLNQPGRTPQQQAQRTAALLDEAADAADGEVMADAARLKAAFLAMEYAPYAEQRRRLEPLAEDGRPYALLAREALAMAQIQAGRARDARRQFVVLSQSLDAPQTTRTRAQAMIAAIDSGAAAQAPAVLRAASAAAPAAAPVPGAPAAAAPAPAQPAPIQ